MRGGIRMVAGGSRQRERSNEGMRRIFQGAVDPGRKQRQAGVSVLCGKESGIHGAGEILQRMKK